MGSSEQLTITERFTLTDPETLEWEVTVNESGDMDEALDGVDSPQAHRGRDLRVRLPRGQLRHGGNARRRPRRRGGEQAEASSIRESCSATRDWPASSDPVVGIRGDSTGHPEPRFPGPPSSTAACRTTVVKLRLLRPFSRADRRTEIRREEMEGSRDWIAGHEVHLGHRKVGGYTRSIERRRRRGDPFRRAVRGRRHRCSRASSTGVGCGASANTVPAPNTTTASAMVRALFIVGFLSRFLFFG